MCALIDTLITTPTQIHLCVILILFSFYYRLLIHFSYVDGNSNILDQFFPMVHEEMMVVINNPVSDNTTEKANRYISSRFTKLKSTINTLLAKEQNHPDISFLELRRDCLELICSIIEYSLSEYHTENATISVQAGDIAKLKDIKRRYHLAIQTTNIRSTKTEDVV